MAPRAMISAPKGISTAFGKGKEFSLYFIRPEYRIRALENSLLETIMPYVPSLPLVHINLAHIRHNYRLLAGKNPNGARGPRVCLPDVRANGGGRDFFWSGLMPVVKADAYGHGHIPVSKALYCEGVRLFASGSVHEAEILRRGLLEGRDIPAADLPVIVSLLGLVRQEDAAVCASGGLVPVIHCFEQINMLEGGGRALAVAIKCNTGMNRLGFNEDELPRLRERLQSMPEVTPVLALSHLHSADSENGREEIRAQAAVFSRMLALLRAQWPELAASLGSSVGTLLAEEVERLIGAHVSRPGVGLYGINNYAGTSLAPLGDGLRQAMSVSAPILAVRALGAGQGIGYGHTFTAAKDMHIGIVGAGYAECYSRGLSNRGIMCVNGVRVNVVGRVSMQMTAVDLSGLVPGGRSADASSGPPRPDTAWLLGGPYPDAVGAEELARLWGTNAYEVFCQLGHNERVFEQVE